jgi:hypothetical protein
MKPLLLITLLSLIWACESSNKTNHIRNLTEMLRDIDSLENILLKNKIDSVVEYQLASNTLVLRIKNHYNPTKIDMNFSRKVDEFKELQMLFVKEKEENKKTLPGEYGLIFSSLKEERKTLKLLYADIENGRGDEKKYDEYINFEKRKINTIQGLLDHYLFRKNKYLPKFRSSMKELNGFMNKWEKEN